MNDDYTSFLDYRRVRRDLEARLARPRWLLLHVLLFILTWAGVWLWGLPRHIWDYGINYPLPVYIGAAWSLPLLGHAVFSFARSGARRDVREAVVEAEMRRLLTERPDYETIHQADWFAMHTQLEADIQLRSWLFKPLFAFAPANAISWVVSAMSPGSSWPFQTTLPLAVLIIGSATVYQSWLGDESQRSQANRRIGFALYLCLSIAILYYSITRPDHLHPSNPYYTGHLFLYWGALLAATALFLLLPFFSRLFVPRASFPAQAERPKAKRRPIELMTDADVFERFQEAPQKAKR